MQIMKGKDSYIITYLYSLSLIHVHILGFFFLLIGNKSIIKIIPETKSNIFFYLHEAFLSIDDLLSGLLLRLLLYTSFSVE